MKVSHSNYKSYYSEKKGKVFWINQILTLLILTKGH